MTDEEAIQMMIRCKAEINQLRNEVEYLRPKAEAYNHLCTVLRLIPQPSMPMGEDFVWTLDKRIKELEEKMISDNKKLKEKQS